METQDQTPAARIAEKFGGIAAWARAYEPEKPLTTVQRWVTGGFVPARHMDDTLAAAKRVRVKLSSKDFLRDPR